MHRAKFWNVQNIPYFLSGMIAMSYHMFWLLVTLNPILQIKKDKNFIFQFCYPYLASPYLTCSLGPWLGLPQEVFLLKLSQRNHSSVQRSPLNMILKSVLKFKCRLQQQCFLWRKHRSRCPQYFWCFNNALCSYPLKLGRSKILKSKGLVFTQFCSKF